MILSIDMDFAIDMGGDEFIVVIKRGMLNKLTMNNSHKSSKAAINELVNRFHKSLEKESKTYPILKYGVSVGYGIYYPKNDDGSNNLVEDAIKEADKMMYEIKVKKALDLLSNTLFIFVNYLGFTSIYIIFFNCLTFISIASFPQ